MILTLCILPHLFSLIMGMVLILILWGKNKPLHPFLLACFAYGVGIAVSAVITFLSFIVLDQFCRPFILTAHAATLGCLAFWAFYQYKNGGISLPDWKSVARADIMLIAVLVVMSIPLWYQTFFYAYGGWDAWSTWNLKANFLFLSGKDWHNMFDPLLWRSSPHYPLLLPLINVWGWIFTADPVYQGPAFTSFIFTFLIAVTITFSLKSLIQTKASIIPAIVLLLSPFFNKLSLSQYADNVVGFYLLAGAFCLLSLRLTSQIAYAPIAGLFLGIMSFAKNEGLLSGVILLALAIPYLWWQNPDLKKKPAFGKLYAGALIGFIPTIIFSILYKPDNITFVNGLKAQPYPAIWMRLKMIFGFYSLEVGSTIWSLAAFFRPQLRAIEFLDKWNGLWVVLFIGLILSKGKCFNFRNLIFPIYLFLFMSVITAYYLINTYFAVDWWMQVTLNRILGAILPLSMFWVMYSLWQDKKG